MPYFLAPFGNASAIDANGNPLVGGSWRTFLSGTTTPATTYTSQAGTTPQGTTMTLDALGLPVNGPVWMLSGVALKFRLLNAAGVLLDEWDNISGSGDTNTTPDEWVLFAAAPTYLSATSFSLVGDQTNIFHVGRRLKSTNSGGTIYSRITASVFGTLTTITVVNDASVLDAGLSAVSYGLLAATNPSLPNSTAVRSAMGVAASGAITTSGLTQSTARLLGRTTAGTGAVEEISVGAGLTFAAGVLSSGSVQIQPISASVASNALTVTVSALSLDFRSATLTSGTVTTVSGTPANLVVPSGATLGTVSAVQSRIVVLALNNAGTIELAVVNISGGTDLTETGLISTTAISAGSTSASVVYSTTARTSVAYRVIGYIESTQATAGTWATAPSTIQGQGGNALAGVPRMLLGTSTATTSGTSIDFTSIPNWVKKITVMLNGVSTSGTSNLIIQLGSGSIQTTGYTGQADSAAGQIAYTNGLIASNNIVAANTHNGANTITLMGSNVWAQMGIVAPQTSANGLSRTAGVCALSGALDRIRLTTANGTDTFDLGSVNILMEGY